MYKVIKKCLSIITVLQSDHTFMFIFSLIKPGDLTSKPSGD